MEAIFWAVFVLAAGAWMAAPMLGKVKKASETIDEWIDDTKPLSRVPAWAMEDDEGYFAGLKGDLAKPEHQRSKTFDEVPRNGVATKWATEADVPTLTALPRIVPEPEPEPIREPVKLTKPVRLVKPVTVTYLPPVCPLSAEWKPDIDWEAATEYDRTAVERFPMLAALFPEAVGRHALEAK